MKKKTKENKEKKETLHMIVFVFETPESKAEANHPPPLYIVSLPLARHLIPFRNRI